MSRPIQLADHRVNNSRDRNPSQMVDEMWNAVLEDSDFRPMLAAWDELSAGDLDDQERLHKRLLDQLRTDMQRIDAALQSRLRELQSLRLEEDHTHALSIEVDARGKVCSGSHNLESLNVSKTELELALAEADLTINRVHMLALKLSEAKHETQRLIALVPTDDAARFPKTFLIEPSSRLWTQQHTDFIQQFFNFTEAEVELVRWIYLGYESTQIAEMRHRSVYTVRKQIKSILEKAEVNSQRQLVQFVASVLMMIDRLEIKNHSPNEYLSKENSYRGLRWESYGERGGRPILLISPTINPTSFEGWHSRLLELNCELIVPYRDQNSSHNLASHVANYLDSLEELANQFTHLGGLVLMGIASGGVYASQLAVRMAGKVSKIICIDTGYPRRKFNDFLSLPPEARRTFVPARYAYNLLMAPHKIVANDFFSSPEGERRVVEYFFGETGHDAHLVKTDEYYYSCTRDLIDYSLSDTKQLVFNVAHWVRDWGEHIGSFEGIKLVSVLGAENKLFDPERFSTWCIEHGWEPRIINNEGQLLLFSLKERLLDEIVDS